MYVALSIWVWFAGLDTLSRRAGKSRRITLNGFGSCITTSRGPRQAVVPRATLPINENPEKSEAKYRSLQGSKAILPGRTPSPNSISSRPEAPG